MKLFVANSVDELEPVARYIVERLQDFSTVCLFGEMGAGKTTLVQTIATILNIREQVSSPTYALVNLYQSSIGDIAHLDLFRLNSVEEAEEIGLEDYLYNNICFVEWSDDFADLMPNKRLNVYISKLNQQSRQIEVEEKL
ncbi:MAG: tRNA (adenosine(37)-N6)-threonylcarbamoyltransferase complex ATPase subunit type 1 TsaE [Chitinophagales bacterium]|nr:tRNA (adenosine(37)-N6)-threonylcarbamoyltransferase complex ATPase subunit type 1 TsaE [Chitinophagales bacterium]